MSGSVDYSKWQPIEHTGVEGDQQRDLDVPGDKNYWGEIGPDVADTWSWTILVGGGCEVAGGFTATEDEAKQAVQAWDDQTRRAGQGGE